MRISIASIIVAKLLLLPALSLLAGDWPHWRGPDRTGVSSETGWSEQWPATGPKIGWKARVGLGYSSFVVAGNRLVTMGHADEKDTVFCFDAATGKELWKHSYPAELGDKHFDGGTTGTPTLDGDRVFVLSRWGDTFCLNAADGKVVWAKNVHKETGARLPDWGFGGAPLVLGDRLILNVGEAGLALDKKTGALLWKSAPKSAGYSTPLPLSRGNETLAVIGSEESYLAVNIKDGKEAWRIRWLTQYGVNAPDPVMIQATGGEQIFLSTGYGKGAALFSLVGAEPKELWKSKVLRTQMNAAVHHKGHLYGVDGDTTQKASLKCIELATGQEKWNHPNFGSGGLTVADGKLIVISGTGELMIAPASPEAFKPTSRAQVFGGKCWTAPVLADGRIYCRNSRGDVVCVDARKQ